MDTRPEEVTTDDQKPNDDAKPVAASGKGEPVSVDEESIEEPGYGFGV